MIPYVSIEGKGSRGVLFLCATVRMAAECRARILWQMVIIRIEGLFCKWALQMQRIFTVSAKEMAGMGYEKGSETADRRNNQADGRSP